MCNGDFTPIGFNDMLGIFLPKGAADDDTKNCVRRSAENIRPIGLKNCCCGSESFNYPHNRR